MKQSIQHIPLILVIFMLAGLISCATAPMQKAATFTNAQWETKAVVKNSKAGSTNSLKIDILGVRDVQARFEISALFGMQIASLVMSPKEISYSYYPQKKFYFGKNSEKAFAPLIDLPLHPMNLTYIAFDQPIRGGGWSCRADAAGNIELCSQKDRGIDVKWLNRNEGAKRVLITAPGFEMTWLFEQPKTSVQFKPQVFTLSQPDGFKAIQIY